MDRNQISGCWGLMLGEQIDIKEHIGNFEVKERFHIFIMIMTTLDYDCTLVKISQVIPQRDKFHQM